ncbi:MAG: acylneuraminate cytidylyltransferase family protein [Candidatus Gastranaerophilales bacterium]|nr:acylneuraminate cytidylyltransferase family protein [Candidatus Gastranaerophilales bacterium]
MKIVGIIPARGGSKGIPRKNIKLLAGKPLVAYSIEAAIKSKYIERVIVSTEDKEIAEISKKYGAEIIERPCELAQDETKTAPVIAQVADELKKTGYVPDIIVLLQPTSPLRDEKIIDAALEQLIQSDKDSIFAGHKAGRTMPLWKQKPDGSLEALYDYHLRPRRQESHLMEPMVCENGAFYAVRYDAFLETKDFLGNNVGFFEMDWQVDVDTLKDFQDVEKILLERDCKK